MPPILADFRSSLLVILFSVFALISACAQTQPHAATTQPLAAVAPTLAPGQLALTVYDFAIPLPAGITENENHEMPGVGFSAIYNAPTLNETAAQAHFDEIMPQFGFTSLGKVGPNLTYEHDDYTLRVQIPGDGFMILTMLKASQ